MAALATRPSIAEPLLVIEDEPRMAMVVARGLSAAGYDVTTAATGLDGLEALHSNTYALVILDLRLPDVDGFALLTRAAGLVAQPVLVLVCAWCAASVLA